MLKLYFEATGPLYEGTTIDKAILRPKYGSTFSVQFYIFNVLHLLSLT